LVELELGDEPDRWEPLGFTVADGSVQLGGVRLVLGSGAEGITRWAVHGIPPTEDIDGLDTRVSPARPRPAPVMHPNSATGLDHVVITTPDFDRTSKALEDHDMPLRRVRDAGAFRQGFRRLGPAILELVEAKTMPEGPARFWGLVVIVADLDQLGQRLGDDLGEPKPAVQPGRRIATLRRSAGLGQPVAFMDRDA
jgi:sensor domain CHASE-containing protein